MPTPTYTAVELTIDDIDLEASPRVRLEDSEELAVALREGYEKRDQVPMPIVYRCGDKLLLADGRHRVKGAKAAGMAKLYCHVRQGTPDDCLREALGSNAKHGLRRTNADKRMCVEIALRKWPSFSDLQIADMVRVSGPLVGAVRSALESQRKIPVAAVRQTSNGRLRPVESDRNSSVTGQKTQKNAVETAAQNPMPARKDPEGAINFPPEPEPVEMDRTEMAQHLQAAERLLLRILRGPGGPDEVAAALTEIRSVRGAIQMELPGMPLADKAGRRGTLKEVLAFCDTKGLPASDGHWFFEKNEGCGWKVNGRAMANWKMTVSAWERAGIFPSQKAAALKARFDKTPQPDPEASKKRLDAVIKDTERWLNKH